MDPLAAHLEPHPALPLWRRSSLRALHYILWQLRDRSLAVVLRVRHFLLPLRF